MDAAFRENTLNERLRFRVHAHLLAGLILALELDHTADLGEERIVAPLTNVQARVDLGPALADDNRAGEHFFTAIPLHAQILRIAVPAVP